MTVYDYPNARSTQWPKADYIIGNPPFVGPARMREALGYGYTEALRKTYKGKVPDLADLVMYWWYHAAEQVKQGNTERFRFITTNSLKQTFNRRVMQPFIEGDKSALVLTFAISDHPWVDSANGAAVRIAMTVGERRGSSVANGRLMTVKSESLPVMDDAAEVSFAERQRVILSDLTIGAELDAARPLKANKGSSSPGVKLHGAGFIITSEQAKNLGLGK